MVTGVNAAGMCKYLSFPSTVPRLRMFGPTPLAPKRLLGVDFNNPQEHVATGLAAMWEVVC